MWGLISKSHLNHNMLITNHKRQSIRTPAITACHLTSSDSQGWSLLLLITKLFLQLPKYVLFRKIVIFHFKSNVSTQAPLKWMWQMLGRVYLCLKHISRQKTWLEKELLLVFWTNGNKNLAQSLYITLWQTVKFCLIIKHCKQK